MSSYACPKEFVPPTRLLLGPGPSEADPRILKAMSKPLLGHLDPEFLRLMDEVQGMLRHVFQTQNKVTFPVSGTGSAGMEAAVVNVVEPGDRVLVGVNGVFGQRMVDVAQRAGAQVKALEKPWGQVFKPAEIEAALREFKPKVLGLVHAETSNGAWQPLEGMGPLAHRHEALLLADCVTSLGGVPVKVDEWEIDVAYSGTQKCLNAPPGLAPITFSDRAIQKIRARKSKVQSWYLDVSMVEKYWGNDRTYHHTAPISMNYGLHEALRIICEAGLEATFAKHMDSHRYLASELAKCNIRLTSDEGHRLPQLNAISIPEGVDDAKGRGSLLKDHGIEIGGGLGELKGKIWRIGLMGYGSTRANVDRVITALKALKAH